MHPPARLYVSLGRELAMGSWGDLRQSKMGYDGHDKYLGLQPSKMGYDGILESNDGICRYPMILDTEDISEKNNGLGIVVLYNGHGISSSEYQVHLSNDET